jgi:hypothetical protein
MRSMTKSMSFSGIRLVVLLGCCAALLVPVLAGAAAPKGSALADPVPLRRVLIAPERVAKALAQAANGVLKKLSHDEFERKLKAAAEAGESLKNAPRLTETIYSAALKGTALEGNGEWKLFNPGTVGILPLPDLSLALKKEEKVQFTRGPAEAIIGDLDGKTLGLLVNSPGHDSVVFAWTARGDRDADGRLRFKLKVPPCAVASLELTVPASHVIRLLSPGRAMLVRRDKENGDKKNSRWLLRFPGQGEVDFLIQQTTSSLPLVLAHQETEQILSPGQLSAKIKCRIEVLHNVARKLYFECDRPLQPFNVAAANTDLKWTLLEAGKSRFLVVELREPKLNPEQPLSPLSIDCLAPLAVNGAWESPGLRLVKVLPWGRSTPDEEEKADPLGDPRLVNAGPRGEVLTLQIHPEVQLASWHEGSFRLLRTETKTDRTRILTLSGNGGPRPGGRILSQGFDCLARQHTWWQIGPRGSTLTSLVRYEVERGRLFQLRLGIPPGWEVDQVQAGPDDHVLRSWAPLADSRRTILLVDLDRALRPQAPVQLTVRLRSPVGRSVPSAGQVLAFPDVEPLDAHLRQGALGISVNSLYQALPRNASVPLVVPDEPGPEKPPWENQTLGFYYPFRATIPNRDFDGAGPLRPAVTGALFLRPYAARVRAGCETDVTLTPDRAGVEIRLHLQPEVGNPRHIDFFVSAPLPGHWSWKTARGTNYVQSVVPFLPEVLPLGVGQPLSAARSIVGPAGGRWWRLSLARPLAEALTLRASFPALGQLKAVPLLSLPDGDTLEGAVSVYLAATDLTTVEATELTEAPPRPRVGARAGQEGEGPVPWRTYRYGHGAVSASAGSSRPSLSFSRSPPAAGRSSGELIDTCRLVTQVEANGQIEHCLTFRVWGWRDRTLAVRLPADAELRAVKAYGRFEPIRALAQTKGGVVVELPVASGKDVHPYELTYSTGQERLTGALWGRVVAPAPTLPVRPLTFRRIWRLAPGVVPLTQAQLRRLPGPELELGFPSFESLRSLLAVVMDRSPAGTSSQRLLFLDAEADLRGQTPAGKTWRLGEALSRLVFEHLKGRSALVLDAQALRDAGLTPTSTVPALTGARSRQGSPLVWEAFGLVYVPCGGAPLLTTARQVELWQAGHTQLAPVSATIEAAVSQAARLGSDGSGRFWSAVDWLGAEGLGPGAAHDIPPLDCSAGDGWTSWEPIAGADLEESLAVVQPMRLAVLGLVLAGTLLLVARWLRRALSPRWQFRLLMVWLAGAGLALLWLPPALRDLAWWPGLVGALLALIWYIRSAILSLTRAVPPSPSHRSHPRPSTQLGAALLLLLGLGGLAGEAADPPPHTVLLVRDPRSADRLFALIPPELDELLVRLARRGARGLDGAVLISAEYRGTVAGAAADFEADFQVYCFSKEAMLTVPLGNVVLKPRGPLGEPALFAGKPAYPVALPRGQAGFTVPLQVDKPDFYTLEMRFSVPITTTENERDLQLAIPRLAQCRLTLDLPNELQLAGAAVGAGLYAARPARGRPGAPQDLSEDTGLGALHVSDDGRRLDSYLGRVGNVHIQWREPTPKEPAAVQVQEMYLWDLLKADASLSGILQYTVTRGAVSQLALGLMEGIDVRSVEVTREPLRDGSPAPRLLKSWSITGAGMSRTLRVDLHRPVTGTLLLILELIPRLAPGPGPVTLILPSLPKEVQGLAGYVGYRAGELNALSGAQNLAVTSRKPAAFTKKWRQAIRKSNDAGAPTFAYSFKRISNGPAALRITRPLPPLAVRQEVRWRVGLRQTEVRARAMFTAPTTSLMLVSWEVPRITVAEISGPDVGEWTQTGSRVQVWLKSPCAQAAINLSGWLTLPAAGAGSRKLSLPCLSIPGASAQESVIGVDTVGGLDLEPGQLRGLTRLSTPPLTELLGGTQRAYVAEQPSYHADFEIRPAHADVRVLTLAEIRDRQLTFTSLLQYEVMRGELRTLRVRLRGWAGDKVLLEAPRLAKINENRVGRLERSWTLSLKPGHDKHVTVKLTGSMPLDPSAGALMPDVADMTTAWEEGSVSRRQRWLGLVGPRLEARRTRGLVRLAKAPPVRLWASVPEDWARRLTGVWSIAADPWQLELRHQPVPGAPNVHLLLDEQAAGVVDGWHWIHAATFWLYLQGSSDLRIAVPGGASVLAVTVDGLAHRVRATRPDQVRLALAAGPRSVRVSWSFAEGKEPLDRPNLTRPTLEAGGSTVASIPALWTIQAPAGGRVRTEANGGGGARPSSAIERDLRRADAQYRLSSLLLSGGQGEPGAETSVARAQLLAAQERLFAYWRQGSYRLELASNESPLSPADNQRLAGTLAALHKHNEELMKRPDLKALGAEARRRVRSGVVEPGMPEPTPEQSALQITLPEQGIPTFWMAADKIGTPRLQMTMGIDESGTQARMGTSLILIALLAAWILSFIPHLAAGVQKTWPEQIVLLGWLIWQPFGYPTTGLALIVLGALVRLLVLARWVVSLIHRSAATIAAPAGGSTASSLH